MDDLMKRENLPDTLQSEDAYRSIRGYVIETQRQVYTAVNVAMVTAYWKIGKKMIPARTMSFERTDRTAVGHRFVATYQAGLYV